MCQKKEKKRRDPEHLDFVLAGARAEVTALEKKMLFSSPSKSAAIRQRIEKITRKTIPLHEELMEKIRSSPQAVVNL